MDKNENDINDYQEQYDILVEEEQEKQRKKTFLIIFFCLLILLFAILGATYSYYKVYTTTEKSEFNIDTDGDGRPDLNVDLNNDGICDVNCDTNGDGKPDINIDYNKDLKPRFNLDLDGDGKPDTNLINQSNNNGIACNLNNVCDLNCDTTGDNHPNINVDLDGDGKPDINIDTDCDGKPDKNVDTNGDGLCDLNCDTEDVDKDEEEEEKKDPIVIIKPTDKEEKGILFINYTKDVNITGMLPDTTVTQTFTVENQSNRTLTYNLNWINVINELSVLEGFTYQIKKDGRIVSEQIPAPTSSTKMVENIIIPANTTYIYEIDYTFHNLVDIDQTVDQNKTFSAQIQAEIIQ